MVGGSADKASKVKSLLASYYDTGDDGAEALTLHDTPRASPLPSPAAARSLSSQLAGAGGGSHDRLDAAALNASYFDPDAYLKRMLSETRLAQLTAKQRDMATEVGGLDSDMQMLVYENYNKFITATDTIKLMSASMEGMDSRMDQLNALIDGVVATSNAVNGKLERRQAEIEELNSVRALLHKLQGVFDLPRKLRAAIERQAFEVAADAYADAAPLLKKYGHKGAFKRVAGEVEACGRELAGILRRQLLAQPDQAAECIQLIAKLGEPTESLQEDYLECKRQRLEGLLAAAGLMLKTLAVEHGLLSPGELGAVDEGLRQRMHAMFPATAAPAAPAASGSSGSGLAAPSSGGEGSLPSLHAVVVQLDGKFISEITHTAALFAQLFPPGGRKRLVQMCRECFARYLKLTRRALSDASAVAAATAAGITAAGQPLQPLDGLLAAAAQAAASEEGYGGSRRAPLDDCVAADWGATGLLEGLYVVKTDLVRLDSLLPELSPRDRGSELVEHTVRQHVSLCFAALERRLLATVDALSAALAGAGGAPPRGGNGGGAEARRRLVAQGLALLQALLVQGLERLLRSLKEYERQKWVLAGWEEVFVNSVHGQVSNLFLSVCQQLLAAAQLEAPSTLSSAVVSSTRSTVESVAPFAAVQRRVTARGTDGGGGGGRSGGAQPSPPPLLLLLLCKLSSFAEQEAVGSALVLLQQLYPERLLSGGEELPAFLPTELGRQLAATAAALLQGYVAAHGAQLAAAVEESSRATQWGSQGEPRAPRPICDTVLEKVAEVDGEVSYLADGGTAPSAAAGEGRRSSRMHSRAASTGSAASWEASQGAQPRSDSRLGGAGGDAQGAYYLEASVGRMLAAGRDRPGSNGGLELTRPSISAALLVLALRALVDGLRPQTLGRGGFQQIQLDVHYMRPELQRLVAGSADGPAVMQLLDELMAVAAERCTEAMLLEASVMDRILVGAGSMRQQQQQQVSLL
ncbi:hypothetical protein D9Q98_009301 [Chlorella vulgaris]|uniref:Vacuolar protein sorting-associated protein 51 homolog n=1 Tax=Chlorella vulgaris TaxID=3077 RepID=A0A9D4TPD3_CHLVU|nr:hypothetical protein D9Q98_009301 [Chlorella vulgaris]